ncbi:hypothetical protein [Candidatus Pyrohabitans sp.]
MRDIEKRISFKCKILDLKNSYFPQAKFKIIKERLNFLKIRVIFQEKVFLDIYYNSSNDRIDFVLIKDGKRIFGYDNLGGWHKHPFENPFKHKRCKKPEIMDIFKEIRDIIAIL